MKNFRRAFRIMWQRFKFSLPLLFFLLLCVGFYVQVSKGGDVVLSSALIGRPVPEFSLPPLEGLLDSKGLPVPGISTADVMNGKGTVILNIWASWCVPCRLEHASLQVLAEEGVTIYGLNYRDAPENALYFLRSAGLPFEKVGVDPKGRFALDWGIHGVPETFIIRDGVILYRHLGPLMPQMLDDFRARLSEDTPVTP